MGLIPQFKGLRESWRPLWERFGNKVVLGLAFFLVGILAFEAGLLQKSLGQSAPVIIRVADAIQSTNLVNNSQDTPSTEKPLTAAAITTPSTVTDTCQFVGSKKSNKYHHPTSRCAKQIKSENKRCFLSVEDAVAKGYLPGCLEP